MVVGADIIRPQKGTVMVPFSMHISSDCFQYIAKSRHNPADFVSRGHRKTSAKWVCRLAWKPTASRNQLPLTP